MGGNPVSALERTAAYRSAIDGVARALERRARNHRNHVIAVVLVTGVCLAAALVARSAAVLAALLLLVPISGAFVLLDAAAVDGWRSALLAGWTRGELDLAGVRAAVRAHPRLPAGTLEGMLATLPSAGELDSERRIRPPTRAALAAVLAAAQRGRDFGLRLNVAASAIVVVALVAALWLRTWLPLLALPLVLLRPALAARGARRRDAAAERELAACRAAPEFSEADFETVLREQAPAHR